MQRQQSDDDRNRMPPPSSLPDTTTRNNRQLPPPIVRNSTTGPSAASLRETQRALSMPRHARVGGTFLGEERKYTRHVLYADEETDFNAEAHDLTTATGSRRRRRRGNVDTTDVLDDSGNRTEALEALYTSKRGAGRPSDRASSLYEDPTSEAGDRPMLEDPDTIMQFRNDMRSTALGELLASNQLVSHERARQRVRSGIDNDGNDDDEEDVDRMRGHVSATRPFMDSHDALEERRKTVETVRAIRRARTNQTLLSIDYTRYLPRTGIETFLRADETRHILRVLIPRLYVDESDKQHVLESQLIWFYRSFFLLVLFINTYVYTQGYGIYWL